MVELVLERARITKEIVTVMLREDQKNTLVGLVSRRPRPKWVEVDGEQVVSEKEIHFNDIIKAALDGNEPS